MTSNSTPTVAVIGNFDAVLGDAEFKAWCFACGEYLSSGKLWASRGPAVTAASKHLSDKHGVEKPSYAPSTARPSDVKVGEVA